MPILDRMAFFTCNITWYIQHMPILDRMAFFTCNIT